MIKTQTAYQAAAHTMKAIWSMYTAGDNAIANHHVCGEYDERDINALRSANLELEDCDNLYVAHLPHVIQDPIAKLLDLCSYSPAGWRDLHKHKGGEYDCCGYALRLDEVTQLCMNLITWFREARVEILDGNEGATILQEDPFIWLLNRVPPVNYEDAIRWRREEIERENGNRLRIARERNELRLQGRSLVE